MKPLTLGSTDDDSLKQLGLASLQIVHDLRNQLNGLKLYATFLRKRAEKSSRPADEQETIGRLITGLERAADDLSMIGQCGRPIRLGKQSRLDLRRTVLDACATLNESQSIAGPAGDWVVVETAPATLYADFDPTLVREAFRYISLGAWQMRKDRNRPLRISLLTTTEPEGDSAVSIQWLDMDEADHDPFSSFASSEEIRMSLAAKIIEAHGGSVKYAHGMLQADLPTCS